MKKNQNRTAAKTALPIIALIILAGAAGCNLEKAKIEQVLEQRRAALQNGDFDSWVAFFSDDYSDAWMPFETTRARAKEWFDGELRPGITFANQEIAIQGDRAVISERFTLEGKVYGRTRRYEELHHLMLVRRSDGWKCFSGSKILALLGGRMEEEHEIEQTLLRREAAFANEDINAYLDLIEPGYHFNNRGRDALRTEVLQLFRVYDEIRIRSYDRKIFFFGKSTTVKQKYNMSYLKMGEARSVSEQEMFELKKTADGWKFAKGI